MIIDTDSNCTKQVTFLVQRGVEAVGRYYAAGKGSKIIKKAEAQALSSKGIKIFTVYEDVGAADHFRLTADQGGKDATVGDLMRAVEDSAALHKPPPHHGVIAPPTNGCRDAQRFSPPRRASFIR
jgi:hypothetical protein